MVRAHHHPKRTGQVALVGIAGAQTPAAVAALAALFQTLRRAVGRNAQLLQHIFQCGLTDEVACVLLTQALHSRFLIASVVPQKHQRLAGKAAYLGQELDAVHVLQSVAQHQNVHIEKGTVWQPQWAGITFSQKMKNMVGDLNICSKKGLSERFDSTIGAATVLMPFGGAHQLTPQNAMVAKLPVDGETNTCSGMAWGYNPYLMSANQYIGARMAVVDSVTKGWVYGWQKRGWVKSDKKPALNVDLWKQLLPLLEKHQATFHWGKGHAGHPENERCDQLAVMQRDRNA